MLKISTVDTQFERQLVLEGQIAGAWVDELKRSWEAACQDLGHPNVVVDLGGVTAISQAGEEVLLEIMRRGAQFTCRDVYIKHVLDDLKFRQAYCGVGDEKSAKK